MSTHEVPVVRVAKRPHPNADALSLVDVYGWTVVVRTADWCEGQLAAYVPPDYVVDSTRREFAFLAGHERIKVRRFRGIFSQGVLVPAPAGASEGEDVREVLGVVRYEPPEPSSTGGETEKGPEGHRPVYDVESWQRYKDLLVPGEEVVVTEKIHGASARYTFQDGRMYVGSRKEWKREDPKNLWWRALAKNPWIAGWCESFPGWTVYGEVFGRVQDLHYGAGENDVFFRAFDLLDPHGGWVAYPAQANLLSDAHRVPVLHVGPYDPTTVTGYAEGPHRVGGGLVGNHLREGCVVTPVVERTCPEIGRVKLKIVGNGYLER